MRGLAKNAETGGGSATAAPAASSTHEARARAVMAAPSYTRAGFASR
jgi:hypothetical protein